MPPFGPIRRIDLVRCLRDLGFRGSFSGGRHQFMIKGDVRLHIPDPHAGDIGRQLLSKILRQGGIPREEWESL